MWQGLYSTINYVLAPLKHQLSFLKQYVNHTVLYLLHCMYIHIMRYMLLFIKGNHCVLTDMCNNSTCAWVRQLCKNMNGYMEGANCGEDCILTACQLTYKMSTGLYGLVMIIINCHCNYVWRAWISRPAISIRWACLNLFCFFLCKKSILLCTFIDILPV